MNVISRTTDCGLSGLRKIFGILPNCLQGALKQRRDDTCLRNRHNLSIIQLKNACSAISDSCLNEIMTFTEWQHKQPILRRQLRFMLGLDPMPDRTPLHATTTCTMERPAYRVEKLVFESVPGLYVTANFYLPHERPSPMPCIVYLNGHWPSLDGAKTGFQDRYLWYPANGFALLVIDPVGFGEVPGVHPGMNRLNHWHWLSLGYTPAGVEVWNAMRALDWLQTRPEVDSSRIGVTGISGGGVMTQFLAALDDRVTVAAASCSTYTIGTQVAFGLVPQQCDCTFYPNLFRIDFPEVLALIAPRPLLILGGRKDPIFPPAGFREAYQRAKRIYGLFEQSSSAESQSRIRLVESGQGHTDPPKFLDETHGWMCRELLGQSKIDPCSEVLSPRPESPESLRCIERCPPSALNYHIHDTWIRRPSLVAPTTHEDWLRRKDELLNLLRTRVFGWFPATEIPFKTRRLTASGGYTRDFAIFGEYEFESEPGVPVMVRLLTPRDRRGPVPFIVWIKGPEDHVTFPDLDEFIPLLRTHALAIITPRFANQKLSGRDYACIERTAALVGRSVASMQVWDVLRTVAWMTQDRGLQTSEIAVYGRGNFGIVGLYAAVINELIGHVILRNPPTTHFDGPALPTVLRDTDIEEIAGTLAKRRLTLLSPTHSAFGLTRRLYDLCNASAALQCTMSLPEAVMADVARRKPALGHSEELKC